MTNGDLMRLAREAAGLTQTTLADAVAVPQAYISRWETGRVAPSDEHLRAVAQQLGVHPALFDLEERTVGVTASSAHARRRRTAPIGVWKRLEAKINLHRIAVENVVSSLDVEAPNLLPQLPGTPPPEAAAMVRMQWRLPFGPVLHLVGWLEAAGIVVIEDDFGTDKVDALSQWFGTTPVLLFNTRAPVDRVRFSLSHELGHLVLHEFPDPDMEKEADEFAAAFLMPAEEIRPQLHRPTLGSLAALKLEWGTSIAALVQRAHTLGTISSERRTSLWKQLSSRGWRKREPGSDELPPEEPSLLRSMILAHSSNGLSGPELDRLTYLTARTGTPYADNDGRLRLVQ